MPPKRGTQSQPSEQSEAANPNMDQMVAAINSLTASMKALNTSNDKMQARMTALEEKPRPFESNLQIPSPQQAPHPNQSPFS